MEQRRNAIVELVNREGSLSFVQLKEAFPSVSEMTLRTDLKALDQARRVVRVHGGVKSVEVVVGTDGRIPRCFWIPAARQPLWHAVCRMSRC